MLSDCVIYFGQMHYIGIYIALKTYAASSSISLNGCFLPEPNAMKINPHPTYIEPPIANIIFHSLVPL